MSWLSAPVSRRDRSGLGQWFWTIDKLLLLFIVILIGVGVIAVAVASPAGAHRLSGDTKTFDGFYFLKRHVLFVLAGVPLLVGASLLNIVQARRYAIIGAAGCFGLLLLVPLIGGGDANGGARWLNLPGFQLQPSEFLKPLFVIATAWLLAQRFEDRSLPAMEISFALLVVIAALLVLQPDYGQTALIAAVWLAQAMLAGMSLWIVAGLALVGVLGLGLAYLTVDHVGDRIDKFISGAGDTYQIDRALDCFRAGGLFGVGPGEGAAKFRLPEPQTDYIFSVVGEEFGMLACLAIAGLYIAFVVRVFLIILDEEDPFVMLAAGGLATQFGLQAAINMAVNVNLLPSKGMTLPFISYGGSSFLALCLGTGLLLALTRRNHFLNASPYGWQPGAPRALGSGRPA